ncbi:MAG: sulfurtransferase-like selenium metabolism protein YedF [Candidatus Eisenbacteria bacterium]|uniref:Sulfurtransferase-like selenium metabolism protein YedF n=1 Tax=Eiseniibacteriota bacterium TaxID=2212470 RepID=A0A948RWY3_UNCEI|nr:sulfurtransferase-like selenium metabolism protein YedF [Candidatus Eisenbacteria bacterium]MBU2691063.1 sulfurtransferase-like selenium metabolism protein YedF [Candidatus Eisenbacteria bacterium]
MTGQAKSNGVTGADAAVLAISSDTMGRGDEALGAILIRSFFHTVGEAEQDPGAVIFYNTGVKLVIEGSPILDDLQKLAGRGVKILACGTCLGHFGLKEKIVVGEISNMYAITEILMGPGKVVNLG